MICRYDDLSRYPTVFLQLTGMRLNAFAEVLTDILPRCVTAEQRRLTHVDRQRAFGGGRHADVAARDQILLTIIWVRQYPTNAVLGCLFGGSASSASRRRARLRPLREAAGRDTMRLPDPGKTRRKTLDRVLAEPPELAVISDPCEPRVRRPRESTVADAQYSGTKQQHTLKRQVAVNEAPGDMGDVAARVVGPPAAITLRKQSDERKRLPASGCGSGKPPPRCTSSSSSCCGSAKAGRAIGWRGSIGRSP